MAKKQLKTKRAGDSSGVFVPAGLLIGLGTGLLIGEVAGLTILGLGVGLGLMALFQHFRKK